MSSFAVRLTLILIVIKLALLFGNRMYVETSKNVLYCDVTGSIVYFDSLPGLVYLAVYAL